MDRRAEVEFLSDGAAPEPDEDVLQLGRRGRRMPPWVWLVALAAVAGLVVAAVVTHPSSKQKAQVPSTPPPTIVPLLPSGASAVAAVSDVPAGAVGIAGAQTWVLQGQRVALLDNLGSLRATGQLTANVTPDPDTAAMLLLGAAHDRLWIVVNFGGLGRVVGLSAYTLRHHSVTSVGAINGAAVLDDRLFVISGRSLIEIVNGRPHVRAVTTPHGEFNGIAADPARGRLLLVNIGFPTQLWSYRPGGRLTALATLPLTKASLAVVAGHVWVGGYGNGGAVLERLDNGRSYPSRLAAQLGPGAVIVGGGQHVVWVREGDADSGGLWCVDAATGHAAQQWDVDGQVASTDGTAVVANGSGLLQLHLAGCRG